jgi:hypothetical protein
VTDSPTWTAEDAKLDNELTAIFNDLEAVSRVMRGAPRRMVMRVTGDVFELRQNLREKSYTTR